MAVKVLVVDDYSLARKLIRLHMEQMKCEVVGEAESPGQALKMFRKFNPQVVIMDVMMPASGGLDSLAALQAMKRHNPNAVVLVVSGVAFQNVHDSYIKAGALAYVIKPFTKDSFQELQPRLARIFPEMA